MPVKIGLFGLGVVGQGLVTVLRNRPDLDFKFYVHVRNPTKQRGTAFAPGRDLEFVDCADAVFRAGIAVVVEVMGGADGLALDVVTRALKTGVPIVTANKALLAKHMRDITSLLQEHNGHLYYEAAVCGGIPVISILREFHNRNNDPIISVKGILNGSTNYLLWKLEQDSTIDMVSMIVDMSSKGFLEADPTDDLEGYDARSKLILIARIAFGVVLQAEDVVCFGVPALTQHDWAYVATRGDSTVRLIASVQFAGQDQICALVMPSIVKKTGKWGLTDVNYNCVEVASEFAGVTTIYGEGAASLPTGNSVAHDVLSAIGGNSDVSGFPSERTHIRCNTWDTEDTFYLRVDKTQLEQVKRVKGLKVLSSNESLHFAKLKIRGTYRAIDECCATLKKEQHEFCCLRII